MPSTPPPTPHEKIYTELIGYYREKINQPDMRQPPPVAPRGVTAQQMTDIHTEAKYYADYEHYAEQSRTNPSYGSPPPVTPKGLENGEAIRQKIHAENRQAAPQYQAAEQVTEPERAAEPQEKKTIQSSRLNRENTQTAQTTPSPQEAVEGQPPKPAPLEGHKGVTHQFSIPTLSSGGIVRNQRDSNQLSFDDLPHHYPKEHADRSHKTDVFVAKDKFGKGEFLVIMESGKGNSTRDMRSYDRTIIPLKSFEGREDDFKAITGMELSEAKQNLKDVNSQEQLRERKNERRSYIQVHEGEPGVISERMLALQAAGVDANGKTIPLTQEQLAAVPRNTDFINQPETGETKQPNAVKAEPEKKPDAAKPPPEQQLVDTIKQKASPLDFPRKPEGRTIVLDVTGMSEAEIATLRQDLSHPDKGQPIQTKDPVKDAKSGHVLLQVQGESLDNARAFLKEHDIALTDGQERIQNVTRQKNMQPDAPDASEKKPSQESQQQQQQRQHTPTPEQRQQQQQWREEQRRKNAQEKSEAVDKDPVSSKSSKREQSNNRIDNAKNHYEILGVERDASTEQIKKAQRAASIQYHPDRAENDTPENIKRMKKVNEASEVLTDPQKRAQYDRKSSEGRANTTKKPPEQQAKPEPQNNNTNEQNPKSSTTEAPESKNRTGGASGPSKVDAISFGQNSYAMTKAIQEGDTKTAVISGAGAVADGAEMARDGSKILGTASKFRRIADKFGPIGKAIAGGVIIGEGGYAAYETEGGAGAKSAAFGDTVTGSALGLGTSIIGLGGTGSMVYDNVKDWTQGKSARHSLGDLGSETLHGQVIELGSVTVDAVATYAGEVSREAKMYGKDFENHKHLISAQQITAKEFTQELKQRGLVTQDEQGAWRSKDGIKIQEDVNGTFLNLTALDYTDRDVLAAYKTAMVNKHDAVDGNMWSRNAATFLGGMSKEQSSQYRTLNAALAEIDDYQQNLESITKEKYAKPLKDSDAFSKLHSVFQPSVPSDDLSKESASWNAVKVGGKEVFILKADNAQEIAETLNKKVFGEDNEAAKTHGFKVGLDSEGNTYVTADAQSVRAIERYNQKDLYQQLNATALSLDIKTTKNPKVNAEELIAQATANFIQNDPKGFETALQKVADSKSDAEAGKTFIDALSNNSPELREYVASLNDSGRATLFASTGEGAKQVAEVFNAENASSQSVSVATKSEPQQTLANADQQKVDEFRQAYENFDLKDKESLAAYAKSARALADTDGDKKFSDSEKSDFKENKVPNALNGIDSKSTGMFASAKEKWKQMKGKVAEELMGAQSQDELIAVGNKYKDVLDVDGNGKISTKELTQSVAEHLNGKTPEERQKFDALVKSVMNPSKSAIAAQTDVSIAESGKLVAKATDLTLNSSVVDHMRR